jgi:CBS domain containing-hemolysin-like protein
VRDDPARRSAEARAELLESVDEAAEADAIDADEAEMILSVVELGETIVREVMVPRTAMVTVGAEASVRQAMSLLLRSGHSRLPVVGEGSDDVLGVAYLKDLAMATFRDEAAYGRPVGALARPALFVPESKPADSLLRELQARGIHLAIVVDEYGGVAGLVTVEDLVEEIVGDLQDEHDPDPPAVVEVEPGWFRVPAEFSLDELGELFGCEIDEEAVDTVGGLLATALGRVPTVGARAEAHGLELLAERAEGRRKQLATILVRRAGNGPAREE